LSSISGLGAGITRRIAQSPEIYQRIKAVLVEITEDVHKRRVKQWAESKEGVFPNLLESRRQAIEELAILCNALGSSVEISPAQFAYASKLYTPPKWTSVDDFLDFNPYSGDWE